MVRGRGPSMTDFPRGEQWKNCAANADMPGDSSEDREDVWKRKRRAVWN